MSRVTILKIPMAVVHASVSLEHRPISVWKMSTKKIHVTGHPNALSKPSHMAAYKVLEVTCVPILWIIKCCKPFETLYKLEFLIRICHVINDKEFRCDQCSSRFANEVYLNHHMRIHHPKHGPVSCKVCS